MEVPVQFICNNKRLYGILHVPDVIVDSATVVIIVTGGPQVRTGAHRLYVQLSRFLCEHNWLSLRFDYEGMGDSEGDFVGFQYAEPSIAAAMNFLQNKFKSKLNFIIWSLCDGATATALYAAMYPKYISGLILCNPLVITEQGLARSTILHYYSKRLFNKEFLQKLARFELDLKSTIKSLCGYLKNAHFFKNIKSNCPDSVEKKLPNMVIDSLGVFEKPIRIILSTDDIVADNFQDELNKNKAIHKECKTNKIISYIIKGADHTFVDPLAKEELFAITLEAVNEIGSSSPGGAICST
jgi:exosortase A-associated hydrolase 1